MIGRRLDLARDNVPLRVESLPDPGGREGAILQPDIGKAREDDPVHGVNVEEIIEPGNKKLFQVVTLDPDRPLQALSYGIDPEHKVGKSQGATHEDIVAGGGKDLYADVGGMLDGSIERFQGSAVPLKPGGRS